MSIRKHTANKEHWEHVYKTNAETELSWFQPYPKTSIEFLESFNISPDAKIIDIGGGDSHFADALLEKGYRNIWVLDISAEAIDKIKTRLGKKAAKINWVVTDITEFSPAIKFDFWHDRATFHFLTTDKKINRYISIAGTAVKQNGYMSIGTFSDKGPKKCSGLAIHQYSATSLTEKFQENFEKIKCINEEHTTPFNTIQSFLFCSFKRK